MRTDVQRLDRRVIRAVPGDEHDGRRRRQQARLAQHLQARRARQVLVGQHQIKAALLHQIDGLFRRRRRGDPETPAPQRLAQHGQHHRLVVDHQHLVPGGDHRRPGARHGGIGDQADVDVAVGGRRAFGVLAGQKAHLGQELDQLDADRLALPPFGRRGD